MTLVIERAERDQRYDRVAPDGETHRQSLMFGPAYRRTACPITPKPAKALTQIGQNLFDLMARIAKATKATTSTSKVPISTVAKGWGDGRVNDYAQRNPGQQDRRARLLRRPAHEKGIAARDEQQRVEENELWHGPSDHAVEGASSACLGNRSLAHSFGPFPRISCMHG